MEFQILFDNTVSLDDGGGDAAQSWVQVAKTGTFKDPRYGTFKITASDFKKWETNFESLVLAKGRLGLPADVDHSPEKKGDTEAVGWIKQLEGRGDELWARVEWNTLGKELIEEKRYAYISPSYTQHFQDETGADHGTALVGIALTNRPFLQMATVNLSQFTFASRHKVSDGDADDVGLKPSDVTDLCDMTLDISDPERAAHATIRKTIDGKHRAMFPIPPGDKLHARLAKAFLPRALAAGHVTDDEAEQVRKRADAVLAGSKQHSGEVAYSHRQMELDAILTALSLSRETLGVAADADDSTVLTALASHQAKPAIPEGHVTLSADTVRTLTSDATAGRAAAEELRVERFERTFSSAQDAGKVVLAQKDDFRAMYDIDGEKTLKLLGGLQPVVNTEPQGVGAGPADLDPSAQLLAGQYTDTVTPRQVDADGLKTLAAAEAIEVAHKVPFEQALAMAERGVRV